MIKTQSGNIVKHESDGRGWRFFVEYMKEMISVRDTAVRKDMKEKCLPLEGSNFRLGGIAPITRAVLF